MAAAKKAKAGPEPSAWASACAQLFVSELDRVRAALKVGDDEAAVLAALGKPYDRQLNSKKELDYHRYHGSASMPEADWFEESEEISPDITISFTTLPNQKGPRFSGRVLVELFITPELDDLPDEEFRGAVEALRRALEPTYGPAERGAGATKKLASFTFPESTTRGLPTLVIEGGHAYETYSVTLHSG
ncbi:Hypothetical protein A7982_02377 [Minicystis rosea]|nr:Hypothetical protein A7982_02377 [Minicystis rosea]